MGDEPTKSGEGVRWPQGIEERGYNRPPVAKVVRPAPSPPPPPAPAPSSTPKEQS